MKRLVLLLACTATGALAAPADRATVWSGGPIITMAGDTPETIEALAVRDGKIIAAGKLAEVQKAA